MISFDEVGPITLYQCSALRNNPLLSQLPFKKEIFQKLTVLPKRINIAYTNM